MQNLDIVGPKNLVQRGQRVELVTIVHRGYRRPISRSVPIKYVVGNEV